MVIFDNWDCIQIVRNNRGNKVGMMTCMHCSIPSMAPAVVFLLLIISKRNHKKHKLGFKYFLNFTHSIHNEYMKTCKITNIYYSKRRDDMKVDRDFLPEKFHILQPNGQILLKNPLIEILGDHRVLVENHRGLVGYTDDQIIIRVNNGYVFVKGISLKLRLMSKEKLVICGKIHAVLLQEETQ